MTSETVLSKDYQPTSIVKNVSQSPPIDLSTPYDPKWVNGRTILITGGASGFGAGMARRWASNGACIIIGDINKQQGEALVKAIRTSTNNSNSAFFVQCNVTSWESQVEFFKSAVKLSPTGGIDTVIANAGIAGIDDYEVPVNMDKDAPPKPNLKTIEVNLIGVLYTVHLALFWLQRNPGSDRKCSITQDPGERKRDRHILLMGSMASLAPIPGQPLYGVSKHGVLGLFRTLRASSWVHGIRLSMLCPYFIDTPIVPFAARAVLAGGAMGKPEDVVEAATRLVADTRIVGRSLYIGPKMAVAEDEEGALQLVIKASKKDQEGKTVEERAIWEPFAEDFEDSELWGKNITRLLNQVATLRGWAGFWVDLLRAVKVGVLAGPKRLFGSR